MAAFGLSGTLPTAPAPAELPPAFRGIIVFLIVATVLSLITRRRE